MANDVGYNQFCRVLFSQWRVAGFSEPLARYSERCFIGPGRRSPLRVNFTALVLLPCCVSWSSSLALFSLPSYIFPVLYHRHFLPLRFLLSVFTLFSPFLFFFLIVPALFQIYLLFTYRPLPSLFNYLSHLYFVLLRLLWSIFTLPFTFLLMIFSPNLPLLPPYISHLLLFLLILLLLITFLSFSSPFSPFTTLYQYLLSPFSSTSFPY